MKPSPHRDWIVMVGLFLCASTARAQVANDAAHDAASEEAVEEIGPSPIYYRWPALPPASFYQVGVSHAIDLRDGATAWGFRIEAGLALAMARDPHHVLVIDAGYSYRGFDEQMASLGLRYLLTDAETSDDVNLRPGGSFSVAFVTGGGPNGVGAGLRVAAGFRWLYGFEVAYEWFATGSETREHMLVFSLGGSAVAW